MKIKNNYYRIIKDRITRYLIIFVLMLSISYSSCKKLVEAGPPVTSLSQENVYSDDATAIAVLTGVYSNLSNGNFGGGDVIALSSLLGLSSDEYSLYNGQLNSQYAAYYKNALTSNGSGTEFWNSFYPVIFTANSAIERLNSSSTLTASVKDELLGEAKFIRAFCYFYLINLYGDVPLVLSPDYKANISLSRTQSAKVWDQIISDLKDAQNLLSDNFLGATLMQQTVERTRPNKWAATALLARTYLYRGDYANAEDQAGLIINNTALFSLTGLSSVFIANSTEAIWQLQPVAPGRNTPDAVFFILPPSGPSVYANSVYLSQELLSKFEIGDQRKTNWIDSVVADGLAYYYPYKYKINAYGAPVAEYEMVFRLAEQYLIRAEARALQNKAQALDDLNALRSRAGLPDYNDMSTILQAIRDERQIELFSEWGHRWFDLKRSGDIDDIMSPVTQSKGGTWGSYAQWYPLPLTDLKTNPNLSQNQGY